MIPVTSLLALLPLPGCTSIQRAGWTQGIETVGLTSAIGDAFTFTQAGLFGLDSASRSFSIRAWGIDEQIVARMTGILGQRFQVQPVACQREAFSAPERVSSFPGAGLAQEDRFGELVRNQVSPHGLDAYVIVTKATLKYCTTGLRPSGVGMIVHHAVFDTFAVVHALYVIRVVDGHSFRTIAKRSAARVDNSSMLRLNGPGRLLDAADLPPISDPLRNDVLKAEVRDLVNQSLEPGLRDLRMAR